MSDYVMVRVHKDCKKTMKDIRMKAAARGLEITLIKASKIMADSFRENGLRVDDFKPRKWRPPL